MYYIYILTNTKGNLYIGYTNNLQRRIKEHQAGETITTNRLQTHTLIYYEAYSCEDAAKERENKLKQYGSSYKGLIKRLKLPIT